MPASQIDLSEANAVLRTLGRDAEAVSMTAQDDSDVLDAPQSDAIAERLGQITEGSAARRNTARTLMGAGALGLAAAALYPGSAMAGTTVLGALGNAAVLVGGGISGLLGVAALAGGTIYMAKTALTHRDDPERKKDALRSIGLTAASVASLTPALMAESHLRAEYPQYYAAAEQVVDQEMLQDQQFPLPDATPVAPQNATQKPAPSQSIKPA